MTKNNKTLQELFDSLNGQEKKLIDGILPPHNTIDDLLSLSEDEFREKLRNSLSPNELESLSDVEKVFRGELMDRIIKVWLSNSGGSGHDDETPVADEQAQHHLGDNEEEEEGEGTPAERLLGLVDNANILFFKDQYKIPNASITFGEHKKILRIESNAFKRYLVKLYYDSTHGIIGIESVKTVIQILQARAEYDGDTYPLALRIAWHDNNIIYDLTNDKWQCIKISSEGWTF